MNDVIRLGTGVSLDRQKRVEQGLRFIPPHHVARRDDGYLAPDTFVHHEPKSGNPAHILDDGADIHVGKIHGDATVFVRFSIGCHLLFFVPDRGPQTARI